MSAFKPATMVIMDNRDRIKEKAYELFMRYGIRSVTMDDIATHMGMSKKTIYQYFADKDELVAAVVSEEIAGMQDDCTACHVHAKDSVEEIFLTMELLNAQMRNMNPMVLYDLEKFHFNAFQKFMQHKNKFLFQLIKENLERGIREELYRDDFNIDIISKFRLEAIMIPFNVSAFPPGKYHLAEVTREILHHYVYGLVTPKGYKMIQKYKQDYLRKKSSDEK